MDNMGENILNELECPLLTLTDIVYCIPSGSISHSVSVVHECSNTCVFLSSMASRRLEHETVSSSQLCYHHDWSNNMYSLNVFCMV